MGLDLKPTPMSPGRSQAQQPKGPPLTSTMHGVQVMPNLLQISTMDMGEKTGIQGLLRTILQQRVNRRGKVMDFP